MLRVPVSLTSGGRSQRMTSSRKISSAADVTDEALIWVAAALLMFGLVMVYSASIAFPESPKYSGYTSTHFLMRHAISMSIALGTGAFCFMLPLKQWQRMAPWLFLFGVFLLAIVLIPMIGKEVYGARRWIPLKVFNLQPSELMKIFVILYAADYTVRKQDMIRQLRKGVLPLSAAVVLVGVLLLLETDLGAFVVISAIAAGMLFLGGISARLFAVLTAMATITFSLVIALSPVRRARIFAYMDPFHPDFVAGKGYQLSQSLIAFGRGEIFGVGLGASVEKLHYLPEPHTDFLLAVIGEELGLITVLIVILVFLWMVRRIFEIGRQAIALDQTFGGLVAYGIALWFAIQAFINMGVNLGVLPTKGLTLPLMSYGGSALLANAIALAIVLRIDFESRRLMRGGR